MSRPPQGGQYTLAVIVLALDLVLHAGASLRGAAAMLAVLAQHGYAPSRTPCAGTIRLWLLRLGCARLSRRLPQHQPWVWLVDHTLQIGSTKLLVIVGCPVARVPFGQRTLTFADLDLIALVPMESSDQATVDAELEKAVQRTGVPAQIVSAEGSDLQGGIKRFQRRHVGTRAVTDVAHAVANLLKHTWENDPRWGAFTRQMHATAAHIRQTRHAYLLVPKLRNKSRYMSVAKYVRFAQILLRALGMEQPRAEVLKYYAWVRDFQTDIERWSEQYAAVQVVLRQVRVEGLFHRSLRLVQEEWEGLSLSDPITTQRLLGRLRGYLVRQTGGLEDGQRLVGSTEVLESIFGVQKRVSGDQSESGLTGIVFAVGGIVGEHTVETLKEDLEAATEANTEHWTKRCLGHTIQWLRRQFMRSPESQTPVQTKAEPDLG